MLRSASDGRYAMVDMHEGAGADLHVRHGRGCYYNHCYPACATGGVSIPLIAMMLNHVGTVGLRSGEKKARRRARH